MIDAEWWLDDEFPQMLGWNCYAVDDPSANGSGGSLDQAKGFMIGSYNVKHGTSLTEDDFTWTEVPRPS